MDYSNRTASARATLTGIAVALVVALHATTAAAQLPLGPQATTQRTHDRDFQTNDYSPCTHELLNITGQEHISESSTPATAVPFKSDFTEHENGKGIGTVTASTYQYQNWSDNHFESSDPNFSSKVTMRKHIIKTAGPNVPQDDWFLDVTMTFTFVNGISTFTVTGVHPEGDCK